MTVTRETAPPTETRVLMVLDSFNFGGAENLVAELGRFAPPGLALSVASLAPQSDGRTAMLDRLTAAGLHPRFLSVRRLLDPAGFVRLVRTLRHAQADVIHAHLGYCAILVTLAARLAGKPVVTTLHVSPQDDATFGEFIKERLAVRIPSRLGRLVLVSHHLYHRYAERHGPARDTWRVIPNAIDVERYTPARGSAGGDRPVWAVVAALRPKKNHLDLIRAWTEVAAVHPGATLLVVGDGPCRAELERAVAEAGLTHSVQFLGSRTDVCEILQGVDGVVSASVDEALPTALIEAAACGVPIVAADAGGTREIVLDGVTGRLVPLRDVPALTGALLEVMGDPVRAAGYGRAARALAEQTYAMPAWANQLRGLYREVIDAPSRRRRGHRRRTVPAVRTPRNARPEACRSSA